MIKEISPAELNIFIRYVQEICGLMLDSSKKYLIECRLSPLLISHEIDSYLDLFKKSEKDPSLRSEIIDAICTHETSFFRYPLIFKTIATEIIPDIIKRQPEVRIWSAGSSTGQEAYSTAIALSSSGFSFPQIQIFGTDISASAIKHASSGVFSQNELTRGLHEQDILTYFSKKTEGNWQIDEKLKCMCTFEQANLLESISFSKPFDIVMCCNVAIYFSEVDRIKIYDNLFSNLKPEGIVILGLSESLLHLPKGISTKEIGSLRVYINDEKQ